jgi:endonuclease YncB( thermonuclease family)
MTLCALLGGARDRWWLDTTPVPQMSEHERHINAQRSATGCNTASYTGDMCSPRSRVRPLGGSVSKKQTGAGCLWLVGLFVVVASCNAVTGNDSDSRTLASGQATDKYSSGNRTTTAPALPPGAEVITVRRALDGDTIELADGQVIDVLGIDSCDPGTYGGDEATQRAQDQLTNPYNQPITMTQEPGVDKGPNGRLLRYIQTTSGKYDFGESQVEYDHTGVLQENNGASRAYMDQLYAHDLEYAEKPPAGRFCTNPYPPSSGGGGGVYVDGDDGDHNMPDGALTGGYCARKWWC